MLNQGFSKQERICSQKIIDKLFNGSNQACIAFPLRAVFMDNDNTNQTQILISVAKKRFHHAVDRNRMKRLIREAYRKNKIEGLNKYIAFICITSELPSYDKTEKAVRKILKHINVQSIANSSS